MKYDFTNLTFLPNSTHHQPGPDELSIRVPAGMVSDEELIALIHQSLSRDEYNGGNWNVLYDTLRFWKDWKTRHRRVVLVHEDLPFSQSDKSGWYSLQTYLHVLLDSMTFLHMANAADNQGTHELVAIFPEAMADELQAALLHPPAWTASIGFYSSSMNCDLTSTFDPDWSTIQQYLQSLDGLLAEVCTITREDTGSLTVHYSKAVQGYYVEYSSADWSTFMVASTDERPALPAFIPFALASQIMETFFTTGERLATVYWSPIPQEELFSLQQIRENWFYPSQEDAQIERVAGMVRITIQEGVRDALYHGEPAFSLEYWKDILSQADAPLSSHLTALCVLGFSSLPQALALIRPFLESSQKQERWVSARFVGGWSADKELVVPILLGMLTDEMPFRREDHAEYDSWYDDWRPYAPRLLQQWMDPVIRDQLRQALKIWEEAEPLLDPEYEVWQSTVKEISQALSS